MPLLFAWRFAGGPIVAETECLLDKQCFEYNINWNLFGKIYRLIMFMLDSFFNVQQCNGKFAFYIGNNDTFSIT